MIFGKVSTTTVRSGERTFHLSAATVAAIRSHLLGDGRPERRGILYGTASSRNYVIAARRFEPEDESYGSLEDYAQFSRLFEAAPSSETSGPLRVVGWYLSCVPGDVTVTARDRQFHNGLFGEEDLILLCERMRGGEVRFSSGADAGVSSRSSWAWAAATAVIFAAVFVTAALVFSHGNSRLSEPARDRSESKPVSQPISPPASQSVEQPAAPSQTMEALNRQLEFEKAHNRRMEATLQILRDRKLHAQQQHTK